MKVRISGNDEAYEAAYHYTTIRIPLTKEIIRVRTLDDIIAGHNASAAKRTDLNKLPKPWHEETDERRAEMTRDDSPLWKEVVERIPDGVFEYEDKTNPMVYIKTKEWCRLLPLNHVEIIEE